MADLSRIFFDFRSVAPNSNFQVFLPQKHYYSSALFKSHNSRINVRRRRRRRSLHLTLLSEPFSQTPSSSELDVISSHEHHDGSIIFRFGDPSEVAKNVKLEESKSEKESKDEEEEGYEQVKVLVGDHETEEFVHEADAEVTDSGSSDPTKSISVEANEEGIVTTEDSVESEQQNIEGEITSVSDQSSDVDDNVLSKIVALPADVNVVQANEEGIVTTEDSVESEQQNIEGEITSVSDLRSDETAEVSDDINVVQATAEVPVGSEHQNIETEKSSEVDNNVLPKELADVVSDSDAIVITEHEKMETETTMTTTTMTEGVVADSEVTAFVLSSGAALLPHPSKVLSGGEDAYFIAGQTWLGVADGVEQWSLQGTKPGVYAQELVKICENLVSDHDKNNPLELLNLSLAKTHSPGSSTVLIAKVDGHALNVANIGDSGFIILRRGSVYKRSTPMLHVFHFPVQIQTGDDPSSLAELYRVDLEENDVIITATDGLLDNLYDQEISSLVEKSIAADKGPEEIAEFLAKAAREVGTSKSSRSPFADDAQAAGFVRYSGGKVDDVAVIVSLVQKQ